MQLPLGPTTLPFGQPLKRLSLGFHSTSAAASIGNVDSASRLVTATARVKNRIWASIHHDTFSMLATKERTVATIFAQQMFCKHRKLTTAE
jgi:hypothetical protein